MFSRNANEDLKRAKKVLFASLIALCAVFEVHAQSLSDVYQITGGVSDARVEFHDYSIKPGEEIILADLDGPGKITYFYITRE